MKNKYSVNYKFPKDFLWGTATSAHQTEGNNIYSDWWHWEKSPRTIEKSGIATDSYNRYEEDFSLAKNYLNNNSIRISVEWARIEPEKGRIAEKEIEHYKKVLRSAKKAGLKIVLTLHHFTNPQWFAKIGGWEKKKHIKYFINFSQICIDHFSEFVDYWIVFNEPNVYMFKAFIQAAWPPQKKSILSAIWVFMNVLSTHKKVYKLIHQKHKHSQVSTCLQMSLYISDNPILKTLIPFLVYINNTIFLDLIKGYFDYVGINYYSKFSLGNHKSPFSISDFGWNIYPKGIYEVSKKTWTKFKKPIIITENGIADRGDSLRYKFIINHLRWVHRAISEGIDIRGYFYWSLTDNFEWDTGRSMRFGLFHIDYDTLKRVPRNSAKLYSEISKNNAL